MADDWEYRQGQRDRAAAIGGLVVIGVLIAHAVAAMVELLVMEICGQVAWHGNASLGRGGFCVSADERGHAYPALWK